jgi:SAM-dependent methyltransferase
VADGEIERDRDTERDATFDMARVREEIATEVRARRAAGVYPTGYERELDALFARFAPPEVTDNLEDALERAEDAASIEPEIPVASNNALFGAVKRLMAKLIGWYHQFLVQQVMALGVAVNNVLRTLVEKVTHLETLVGDDQIRRELDRIVPEVDDELWRTTVVDAARGLRGRVALVDAGDGGLLRDLRDAGLDVYGVEPRPASVDLGRARGLDVRINDVATHLDAVAAGDLSGLLLRGCIERSTVGELLDVVGQAARVLSRDGRLILMSRTPEAWGRSRSVVEVDLARGRPLHARTWAWLLEGHGFDSIEITPLSHSEPLALLAADGPDAETMNRNLARLSETLFQPEAFVVVARRSA